MNRLSSLLALGVVTSIVACATPHDSKTEPEPVQSASAPLVFSEGLYPYPVTMKADGVTPATDGSGALRVAWTGSMADLMAADAYSDCFQSWEYVFGDMRWDLQNDDYINYLASKMGENQTCDLCKGGGCDPVNYWKYTRSNSKCNYNTSNRTQQAIDFDRRDISAYSLGIGRAATAMQRNAQKQLGIAEVNLCMAQKLREEMVTAPGLLFQSADVREALEVIRERAQLAMLQYGLLGVAFTSPDTGWAGATLPPGQFIGTLRAWANNPTNAAKVAQLGRDFAAAIEVHTQVTRELGDDLARAASARTPWPNGPADQASRDWGTGSYRERVLRLLYGGDPLARTQTAVNDALWQAYAPPATLAPAPLFVREDARTPNVEQLLTYARRADALYFRADAPVDTAASAVQLYRTVEASLRHPSCIATTPPATPPSPTCAQLAWGADVPDPNSAMGDALLFRTRKITLTDALALTTRLGQAIPTASMNGATVASSNEGAMHFTGALQVVSTSAAATSLPGAPAGSWYHLPPTTSAIPRSPIDRGSPYLGTFFMPMTLDAANVGLTQGFTATFNGNTSYTAISGSRSMRTLGAVSALAAARDAIFTTYSAANGATGTAGTKGFASAAATALPLVDAAVGTRTAGIRPQLGTVDVLDQCTEFGMTSPGECKAAVQTRTNGVPTWQLTVQTTASDTYSQLAVIEGDETTMAASAALDSSFVSYTGATMASLVARPTTQILAPTVTQTGPNNTIRRVYTVTSGHGARHMFFVVQPGMNGAPSRYRQLFGAQSLAGSSASLWVGTLLDGSVQTISKSLDGRWITDGGSLNAFAERLWTTQGQNWSQPQYDGFGVPTNWFPPAAELAGGAVGESAISLYTNNATALVQGAQSAVATAVNELLRQETDQSALDNARINGASVAAQTQQQLCGTSAAACANATSPRAFNLFADPLANNASFVKTFNCTASADECKAEARLIEQYDLFLRRFIPPYVTLPKAVFDHRWDPTTPDFSAYAGGSLKNDFIKQWATLAALQRATYDASFVLGSKIAAAAAGHASLKAATDNQEYQCDETTFTNAITAGYSYSGVDYITTCVGFSNSGSCGPFDPNTPHLNPNTDDKSLSMGPLWSQVLACRQAGQSIGPAQAQAAASVADAWSTASNLLAGILSTVSEVRTAGATVEKDVSDANLAIAQAQLGVQLTAAGLTSRFGTTRRFHSLDMWNAQKAIRDARLDLVYARRAIESRYVTDLSTLAAPEAMVAAPATWADSVYSDDQNILGPTGVSVSGVKNNQTPPFNASALAIYLTNLNQFQAGYFASPTGNPGGGRQAASNPSRSDILTLPAPDGRTLVGDDLVLDPAALAWSFQCPGSTAWFANPAPRSGPVPTESPLSRACNGKPPAVARILFGLDGWGRLDSDEANITVQDPMAHNFNVRWNRVGVNLTGTGIKDCATAPAGSSCNASAMYLPFNLRALGPSWVTDYYQSWHVLGAPVGVIENGQAGAVGTLWTVPAQPQAASEIASLAHVELKDRPVAGTYQLDLILQPGVVLANATAVQLYTDTTFWVRQQ
jgi:hypothetical protein